MAPFSPFRSPIPPYPTQSPHITQLHRLTTAPPDHSSTSAPPLSADTTPRRPERSNPSRTRHHPPPPPTTATHSDVALNCRPSHLSLSPFKHTTIPSANHPRPPLSSPTTVHAISAAHSDSTPPSMSPFIFLFYFLFVFSNFFDFLFYRVCRL